MTLQSLGWTPTHELEWQSQPDNQTCNPARVASSNRNLALLFTPQGKITAHIPPPNRYLDTYPVVGDWCAVQQQSAPEGLSRIRSVLPRDNQLSRKTAGKQTSEQVIAANIDRAFILTTRGEEFSWNRIDRFLAMILNDGIRAAICLTKTDLDPDPEGTERTVQKAFPQIPVISVSSESGAGMDRFAATLQAHETAILQGSSGVGKSTLTNQLLSARARDTQEVREWDQKGRHTTSNSEMFPLPNGTWLIDAPGIREIQPWDSAGGVEETFSTLSSLAAACRFRNCHHQNEPGCAIMEALEQDLVTEREVASYLRLAREQAYQERRVDQQSAQQQKRSIKSQTKLARQIIRRKRGF